MSQDEQDAILGRLMRERGEATRKFEALRSKAIAMGNKIKNLGMALEKSPELVAFHAASTGANSTTNANWFNLADYPQVADVVAVGNEIRETMETVQRLQDQIKRFGV